MSVPTGCTISDAAGNDLTAGQTPPVAIGTFSLTAAPANSPDLQGFFKGKIPASVIGGNKGVGYPGGFQPEAATRSSRRRCRFPLYASQTPTASCPASTNAIKVVTSRHHLEARQVELEHQIQLRLPPGTPPQRELLPGGRPRFGQRR